MEIQWFPRYPWKVAKIRLGMHNRYNLNMLEVILSSLITNKIPLRPYKERHLSPNNPYQHVDRIYYQGDFRKSSSMYENILPQAYTDNQKIRAYHGIAWSYIGIGRFLEAQDYFEKASVLVRLADDVLENKLGIAFVRYFRKDFNRALQNIELAKAHVSAGADGLSALMVLEGAIYWETGDKLKAKQLVEQAYNKYPNTYWGQLGLLLLANAFISEGNFEEGEMYLKKLISNANDEDVLNLSAHIIYNAFARKGNLDKAIEYLSLLSEKSPKDEPRKLAKGYIYELVSKNRNRLITNDELLRKSRTLAVYVLYNPGVEFYNKGDYFSAKPLLEKFVSYHPSDTLALRAGVVLAKMYLEEKDYKSALSVLKKLDLEHLPYEIKQDAYYYLALAYLGLGDLENSAKYFSKLVESTKYGKLAQEKLVSIVANNPEYGIYLPPEHPLHNYSKAVQSLKQGDTLSAINYLERYMQTTKGMERDEQVLLTLIELSYKTRAYDKALKYAKMFINRGFTTKRDVVLFIAGASAYQLGYKGEALEYWDRLLYEYPNSEMASKALYFARQLLSENPELFSLDLKSSALVQVKSYQRAYDLYKRGNCDQVISMLENDASNEAKYLKGRCYLSMKNYQKAYEMFSSIKETPEVALFKAEALLGMKKYRQALKLYTKALNSQNPKVQEIARKRISQLRSMGIN